MEALGIRLFRDELRTQEEVVQCSIRLTQRHYTPVTLPSACRVAAPGRRGPGPQSPDQVPARHAGVNNILEARRKSAGWRLRSSPREPQHRIAGTWSQSLLCPSFLQTNEMLSSVILLWRPHDSLCKPGITGDLRAAQEGMGKGRCLRPAGLTGETMNVEEFECVQYTISTSPAQACSQGASFAALVAAARDPLVCVSLLGHIVEAGL